METARFLRPIVPENERFCYCQSEEIESEYHVLFICEKYANLRQIWLNKLNKPENFSILSAENKFKIVLNEASNVKYSAQFLIDMMDLMRLPNDLY